MKKSKKIDSSGELIELLADLRHDLGKYIRLPLSMLPRGSSSEAVLEAVRQGLSETVRGPQGPRSARQIWEGFVGESGGAFAGYRAFKRLSLAVEIALGWEDRLADDLDTVNRNVIERDLNAVGVAIQRLLQEVQIE